MALKFLVSNQTNPYWNIAVENYLVEHADGIVLYLWKNHRTVVIGQNQNPFTECDVDTLEADGGYLMRRKTGGGAVYHDDGNINFSFVVPKEQYDVKRQFSVIQRAVESFGLSTELSGRNDILVDAGKGECNKRKFSGNAFSKGRINNLHHGTILIKGNIDELQRYLKPKPAKLQKHGVSSVRSRVINLAELNPEITSDTIVPRLLRSFKDEYGENIHFLDFDEIITIPAVKALYKELSSDEWLYGRWRNFSAQRSGQFPWGEVDVAISIKDNVISDVQLASDALDLDSLEDARNLAIGRKLTDRPNLTNNPIVDDIMKLLF